MENVGTYWEIFKLVRDNLFSKDVDNIAMNYVVDLQNCVDMFAFYFGYAFVIAIILCVVDWLFDLCKNAMFGGRVKL